MLASLLHLLTRYSNPVIQFTRVLSLTPYCGPREISTELSQMFLQVKVLTLLPSPFPNIFWCVLRSTEEEKFLCNTFDEHNTHTT